MSSSSSDTNYESSSDPFGNSSLDHALLESLFYTEMMHMNDADSSVLSNQLLSSLTADGLLVQDADPQSTAAQQEIDPNIAAEKDLLNHFGVNDFAKAAAAALEAASGTNVAQQQKPPATQTTTPPSGGTSTAATPYSRPSAQSGPIFPPPTQTVTAGRKVSSLTASVAPDLVTKMAPVHHTEPVAPTPSMPQAKAAPAASQSAPPLNTTSSTQAPPAQNEAASAQGAAMPVSEEEKRSKLVNQFATLASRLGIVLPNNVLQSLSQVAGTRTAVPGNTTPYVQPTASSMAPVPPLQAPPTVQQLAETAEAAITSVSRKRARSESPPQQQQQQQTQPSAAASNNAKRRKKPRLVECEQKLAELKAENAMLKRHLANLSAQSHQLEQDRVAQEQRMRQMAASGSTEEELNEAIQTFQDMYSDYGRRRHQEITFHLDQLLRLANPTNFTKMGLWTMGQQSRNNRNPIASILQKELGITPQQGKKIVEQREKIRNVCANMKETLLLLGQLKALCEQKTKIFHDRMTKCREILKPSQVVKCLVWIDQNSEMLAKICPGWGSEQMVAGPK